MTRLPSLFSAGAHRYDLLVAANPGYHQHLRLAARKALTHRPLPEAPSVLDLGCGTGASTRALLEAAPDARVTGVDASPGMIEQARAKDWPQGQVQLAVGLAGDPEAMGHGAPYDACFAAYLLRNVPAEQRSTMLAGVREQMREGSVIALQDYTVAHSRRAQLIWDLVSYLVVIPLAALVLRDTSLYRYLWRSVRDMEGVDAWCEHLRRSGFEPVAVHRGSGWQSGILHTVIGVAR